MGDTLGTSVVIDNKPGANGNIAGELVAKSPPDGYTVLYNTSSIASSPALYGDKLKYDVLRDLTPIGRATSLPMVLLVGANSQFRTVEELVSFMRANPGKVDYASGGNGNVTHLSALAFEAATGTRGLHVPYKGRRAGDRRPDGGSRSVLFCDVRRCDSGGHFGKSPGACSRDINALEDSSRRANLARVPSEKMSRCRLGQE